MQETLLHKQYAWHVLMVKNYFSPHMIEKIVMVWPFIPRHLVTIRCYVPILTLRSCVNSNKAGRSVSGKVFEHDINEPLYYSQVGEVWAAHGTLPHLRALDAWHWPGHGCLQAEAQEHSSEVPGRHQPHVCLLEPRCGPSPGRDVTAAAQGRWLPCR